MGSYKRDVVTIQLGEIVFTGNLLCMGACLKTTTCNIRTYLKLHTSLGDITRLITFL